MEKEDKDKYVPDWGLIVAIGIVILVCLIFG